MKKIYLCLLLCSLFFRGFAQSETFHDFYALKIQTLDTLRLSDYLGKKVLVVNVASFCGFTPQYPDLVALDTLYGGSDFAIVAFPCNDFGGQEPYDDSTIVALAQGVYQANFQMMHKISITAIDTAEVYKWLQLQSRNGVADAPVTWNFNKFCIDEAGHWVKHFPSAVNPLDTAITNWIQSPNVTGVFAQSNPMELKVLGNPSQHKITLSVKTLIPSKLNLSIYDLQGRKLDEFYSGNVEREQTISYQPKKLSAGTYFIRLQSEQFKKTIKVTYEP